MEIRITYLDEKLKSGFLNQKKRQKEVGKISSHVFLNESEKDRIKDSRGSWAKVCTDSKIEYKLFHDFR